MTAAEATMPVFLSADELRELTGFAQTQRQIAQLQSMGVAHFVNGKGVPLVARTRLAERQERKAAFQKWAPLIVAGLQGGFERTEALKAKARRAAELSVLLSSARRLRRAGLVRHHAGKRRAARLRQTPPWANMEKIRSLYDEAAHRTRLTGISHHVDHEIPLQGELVSGLHVHNNLQILTGSENSRKRNKYEVE